MRKFIPRKDKHDWKYIYTMLSSPVNDQYAANKVYVDNNAGISKTGGEMLFNLNMNNF